MGLENNTVKRKMCYVVIPQSYILGNSHKSTLAARHGGEVAMIALPLFRGTRRHPRERVQNQR